MKNHRKTKKLVDVSVGGVGSDSSGVTGNESKRALRWALLK